MKKDLQENVVMQLFKRMEAKKSYRLPFMKQS